MPQLPQRQRKPSITSVLDVWRRPGMALAMLCFAQCTNAVEVLSVHELVSHCEHLEAAPQGVDAQYCIRYMQGFIDGAVATDVRVMLNVEAESDREETFTERAIRTRAPGSSDRNRAAQLAGFCLGDPLPLREVVDRVVADLLTLDVVDTAAASAREAVYGSLRDHYPCKK